MSLTRLGRTTCGVAVAFALLAGTASADVRPEDSAAARALFDQGRALADKGKYAEACGKLEESQKLDPGAGTLFHLADCYEHVGKTASAWGMFLDVASQSAAAKRAERETAARERATALRPKLAQVTIVVDSSNAPEGLEIKRDGTAVGKGMWGTPVPVDPGQHKIDASAPGFKAWTTSIDVPSGPNNIEIKIPALAQAAATDNTGVSAAASSGPDSDTPPSGSSRKTIGLVVGGIGLAAFGASVGLSLHAKSKFNESSGHCDGSACDKIGADARSSAVSEGNIATIVGGVGLAALATGVVLFLTAPKGEAQPSKTASRMPQLSVGPGSISLGGSW